MTTTAIDEQVALANEVRERFGEAEAEIRQRIAANAAAVILRGRPKEEIPPRRPE